MSNKGPTQEQLEMRELVEKLRKEEHPLTGQQLIQLQHFVSRVREEIVEDDTPGKRSIRRISYYMLNERGLKLLEKWNWGQLDKLVKG